uniref:C-type lectin domain-containing protein n=1 Tax=Oryzias latipes TaxID=8090 RepID=A0A3B3HBE8_ORYLA
MDRILFTVLVFISTGTLAAKHVFISEKMSWDKAQVFCRTHHTDLSPISNAVEGRVFKESLSGIQTGWVGLYWDVTELKWKWSGGAADEDQGWLNDCWVSDSTYAYRFFCLNLIMVQEEKTWEEALEHCRGNHGDLTSLLSETGNLLAQREIQDPTITQRVWVGLRFLGDTWLWANGDPLEFQAWTQTGDPDQQCPVQKRCGALTKQGEWENRDCQEKLNFICI